MEFVDFPKIPRYSREVVITEKIDGMNVQLAISLNGEIQIGTRNGWMLPVDDNEGIGGWVRENHDELLKLGPGRHFGEWYGFRIGKRQYDLKERRFALFNVDRWSDEKGKRPACCEVVPIIERGILCDALIESAMEKLRTQGSFAVPGFMRPEGIVIYHVSGGVGFKKTLLKDEVPKGKTR